MIMDEKLVSPEILQELRNLLNTYYPTVIDNENGGYYSNFNAKWEKMPQQEKMIVTQARHIWACSKASSFLDDPDLLKCAEHGYDFLSNKMWDNEFEGFFQICDFDGSATDAEGWFREKRAYGNAFAIYGLAAIYQNTKNEKYLDLAKKTFNWLETNAYDKELGGYFQFFTNDNQKFDLDSEYKSRSIADKVEIGYKDQNSSIHLLEAYTELYHNWKDEKLKKQLTNLLILIRDKLTNPKGFLHLFFDREFNPICFNHENIEQSLKTYQLEHVSFGHDYETAFLMLEASYTLGLENDTKTLQMAKQMADHALENGWDNENFGFFDGGYYFEDKLEIIKITKNWWAQAEALNIYLMLYLIFEDEKYLEIFNNSWRYIKKNILDKEIGDWYWNGLDTSPESFSIQKSSIWKCTYHNARALMNCYIMLSNFENSDQLENVNIKRLKEENQKFITHWKRLV